MNSAMETLDAVGKLAAAGEAASAVARMREVFQLRERLLDPGLSDDERQRLIDQEAELTRTLAEDVGLAVITELSPQVAMVYGAWTVGCMAGEFRSPTREGSNLTCGDRQMTAVDHAIDWLSGKRAEDELTARRRCNQFRTALRERRIRLKGEYSAEEVCGYIRYGTSIVGTYEPVPEEEQAALTPAPSEPLVLPPVVCDQAANRTAIASLNQAATDGRPEALAHIGLLRSVNAQIGSAKSSAKQAQQALRGGDVGAARSSLQGARAALESLSGKAGCNALLGRLETNLGKVDRFERIQTTITNALGSCNPETLNEARNRFANVKHPAIRGGLDQVDAMLAANSRYQDARASFRAGSLQQALSELRLAETKLNGAGSDRCPALRQKISSGLGKIEQLRDAIHSAENALAACDPDRINRAAAVLGKITNPAVAAVRTQLENGEKICRERERQETIATITERCISKYGEHATADLATVESSDPLCQCGSGYRLSDANKRCEKAPSARDLAGGRDTYCRNTYGSGFFAGPPGPDGKYFCRADKKTARADCRRQARQKKKVYAYTRYKKDGTYDCFWCEPGYRYSKGRCVSKTQRVVKSCPKGYVLRNNTCHKRSGSGGNSGGGRRYACTIYNPDGSLLGGGGSYSTVYVNSPVRGANCRRIQ